MRLIDAKEGTIFEILKFNLPKNIVERFNSLNLSEMSTSYTCYIVEKIVDKKHIEILFYSKENRVKILLPKIIIGYDYLDKIEIRTFS